MAISQALTFGVVLSVVSVLTVRDLFSTKDKTTVQGENSIPSYGQGKFAAPAVKFLFWRVFEEYAHAINQRFPQMQISGGNFPPGTIRQSLATILSISKLAALALIVFGSRINLFEKLQIAPPPIYVWASQNKIYACIITFFLSNAIEGQLLSTGAFEISLNGMPIWSKLQSGRIPQPDELFDILNNHLKMVSNTANTAKYK